MVDVTTTKGFFFKQASYCEEIREGYSDGNIYYFILISD